MTLAEIAQAKSYRPALVIGLIGVAALLFGANEVLAGVVPPEPGPKDLPAPSSLGLIIAGLAGIAYLALRRR